MPEIPFSDLPNDARLWAFGADRPLDPAEQDRLSETLSEFLRGWAAHGRPVTGAFTIVDDRFVLVAADERASGVSGCSIDALQHRLGDLERSLQVRLRDRAPIWYRDREGTVRSASRDDFRQLAREGEVDSRTTVFDPTITTVADLREGRWERPARESWHARLLPEEAVRSAG